MAIILPRVENSRLICVYMCDHVFSTVLLFTDEVNMALCVPGLPRGDIIYEYIHVHYSHCSHIKCNIRSSPHSYQRCSV